jgi:hypothetical protein
MRIAEPVRDVGRQQRPPVAGAPLPEVLIRRRTAKPIERVGADDLLERCPWRRQLGDERLELSGGVRAEVFVSDLGSLGSSPPFAAQGEERSCPRPRRILEEAGIKWSAGGDPYFVASLAVEPSSRARVTSSEVQDRDEHVERMARQDNDTKAVLLEHRGERGVGVLVHLEHDVRGKRLPGDLRRTVRRKRLAGVGIAEKQAKPGVP